MKESKFWYLEEFNIIKALSMSEMKKMQQLTSEKVYQKGDFVYFQDGHPNNIYFLKKGRVKVASNYDDGREIIKGILHPGEIFGELAILGDEKREDFAVAQTDKTVICIVAKADLEDMMQKSPAFGIRVTKLLGFKLKKIERRLESLVFKDARTRIVDFLRDQANDVGSRVGYETLIPNNFTHKDIAKLTATSRQTVTTVLNELRDQNQIYFDRKRILIRDLEKLS